MTPSEKRANLILQVQTGQITATQAAQALGISRQAYYKWEQKALQALLKSLEDQSPGRPPSETDPHKSKLQKRVEELERENQLLKEREQLRKLLKEMEESDHSGSSTKKNSK